MTTCACVNVTTDGALLTLLMQLGQYHTPMGVVCTRGNRHKGWYTRSHPLQNRSSSELSSLPHSSHTSGFTLGSRGNEGGWAGSGDSTFIRGEGVSDTPYSHSIESSIWAGHTLSDHTHIITYDIQRSIITGYSYRIGSYLSLSSQNMF